MQAQLIVLTFSLLGAASCVLAVIRRGGASLLTGSLAAALLALLAHEVGNLAGTVCCLVVALAAAALALARVPWIRGAPLGPLVTLASMGVYLRCVPAGSGTLELLALLGLVLGLYLVTGRELLTRAPRLDAATVGVGILALGFVGGTGWIRVLDWGLDAALLALPLLAVGAAGAFRARGAERGDLVVALGAAAAVLVLTKSYAELCLLLAVIAALYVLDSPHRGHALLVVATGAAVVGLLGIDLMEYRFLNWLSAPRDVYGSGFDLNLFYEVLRRATPLGTGVPDVATLLTSDFPAIYTLGQAVSAFGVPGIALPILCVASVAATTVRALPALSPSERALAVALGAILAGCALGNLAYVFHVLPVPSLPFPFLSSSVTGLISLTVTCVALAEVVGMGALRSPEGAEARGLPAANIHSTRFFS